MELVTAAAALAAADQDRRLAIELAGEGRCEEAAEAWVGAPARRAAQAAPSPHLLQHSPPPPRLLSRRSKLVGRRQINQRRSQCHMRAAERTCRPAADP